MQKIKKTFLILQYSTLKSTLVQYNSWHPGAGIEWTGKKCYWLEEGEEVGDGRAEGLSTIGDGGQAAISLTPDIGGTRSSVLRYFCYFFFLLLLHSVNYFHICLYIIFI